MFICYTLCNSFPGVSLPCMHVWPLVSQFQSLLSWAALLLHWLSKWDWNCLLFQFINTLLKHPIIIWNNLRKIWITNAVHFVSTFLNSFMERKKQTKPTEQKQTQKQQENLNLTIALAFRHSDSYHCLSFPLLRLKMSFCFLNPFLLFFQK